MLSFESCPGAKVVVPPPSQTWRIFLTNHVATLASMDFFGYQPSLSEFLTTSAVS